MTVFWILVGLGAVAWFVNRYFIVTVNNKTIIGQPQQATKTAQSAPPGPTLDDIYELEIKGESFYQDALIALFGAYSPDGHNEYCGAELVREPTNKHDKNAVRCEIGGLLVGHVNKDDAEAVSKHIAKGNSNRMNVNATVTGGWRRNSSDTGLYGVMVEIEPEILEQ